MQFFTATILTLTVALARGSIDDEAHMDQQVTQLLTIKNVLTTIVSTVLHTNTIYPTCTTTVSGITRCAGANSKLSEVPSDMKLSTLHQFATNTKLPTLEEGSSSTYQLAEVVMPSCDCAYSPQARSPRLLGDNVLTIKKTTTVTTHSVVHSTDTSTTVSITYNGCIPFDAPNTIVCEA